MVPDCPEVEGVSKNFKRHPVLTINACLPDIPGPLDFLHMKRRVPQVLAKEADLLINRLLDQRRKGLVERTKALIGKDLQCREERRASTVPSPRIRLDLLSRAAALSIFCHPRVQNQAWSRAILDFKKRAKRITSLTSEGVSCFKTRAIGLGISATVFMTKMIAHHT